MSEEHMDEWNYPSSSRERVTAENPRPHNEKRWRPAIHGILNTGWSADAVRGRIPFSIGAASCARTDGRSFRLHHLNSRAPSTSR